MFLEGETKHKTQKIRFLLILISISYSAKYARPPHSSIPKDGAGSQ